MRPEASPVYEVFLLQVLHGRGDLCSHVEQHHSIDLLSVTLPQVIQKVTVGHELCDDVKRRLSCANTYREQRSYVTNQNKRSERSRIIAD